MKHYVENALFIETEQGKVAALFLRDELYFSKAAVFEDPDNPHSFSLSTVFRKKFLELGGRINDRISVAVTDKALSDRLEALQVLGTQSLYLPVDAGNFIRISKAVKAMGWNPLRMGSDGLYASVVAQHPEDLPLLEETLGIEFYSSNTQWVAFGRQLLKRDLKPNKNVWDTYSMAGAEGMALMWRAVNNSETSGSRSQINKNLKSMEDFPGFMGRIAIQANGKVVRPLIIHEIKNGCPMLRVRVH